MKKIIGFILLYTLLIILVRLHALVPSWQWVTAPDGYTIARAIKIDGDKNNYITGNFNNTATFGFNSITSKGSTDVFVAKVGASGNWLWANSAGGAEYDRGRGIAIDDAGNSYVTGDFDDTAYFGSYTLTGNGVTKFFVAKTDANGNWLWANNASSNTDCGIMPWGIATDDAGNSYVTGRFRATAYFGPYFGPYSITSNGAEDVFVAKIDANGNWLWANNAGSSSNFYGRDLGRGIATDDAGNSYVTGHFTDTAYFGSYSITSNGYKDVFVAKMDANGNWLWASNAGGSYWDEGRGIAIDNAGNTYVTGFFQQTATFGSYSLTSNGGEEIFVAKMDANGNWLWANNAGGSYWDSGRGIATDDAGNSYVTGDFEDTANFGSYSLTSNGEKDVFTAKMDANGNWQWAIKAGGSYRGDSGKGIAIDDAGNAYITGNVSDDAVFGSNVFNISGSFVAKVVEIELPLYIWPGDTNYDGNVDELDVDAIAAYLGENGTPRANISFEWQEYDRPTDWNNALASMADCNGDGEVNITDVVAILLNWHYSYNATTLEPLVIDNIEDYRDNFLEIYNSLGASSEVEKKLRNHIASIFNLDIKNNLSQNSPNPFKSTTTICYSLKKEADNVFLEIFNLKGQLVKEIGINNNDGFNSIIWDGTDMNNNIVPSGIYFYRLENNGMTIETKKMIKIK